MATSTDTLGPWDDGPISVMGGGNTRDDAYYEAFSNCNALVTTALAIGEAGSGYAQTLSDCRVTGCNRW